MTQQESQNTPQPPRERIGFIGLGDMGKLLARRFLRAGYPLTVCDINPLAVAEFRDKGAQVADTPAQTASQAEVVFACLPAPSVSELVAFGEHGVVHGSAIRVYVETSTMGYATMRRIAEALAPRGIGLIDSPTSGGPLGEARGKLSCFVATPQENFDRTRDMLTAMSDRLFHVGDTPGQSQVLKLSNNLLNAASMTLSSEMVLMAMRAGIDPNVAIDVINVSTGRNRATEDLFKTQILNGAFATGARMEILGKDVFLALEEAERLGTPHHAASAIRDIWEAAIREGHGAEDYSNIFKFIDQAYSSKPAS